MAFYINASQYWRKERHWNQMGLHSFKAFKKNFLRHHKDVWKQKFNFHFVRDWDVNRSVFSLGFFESLLQPLNSLNLMKNLSFIYRNNIKIQAIKNKTSKRRRFIKKLFLEISQIHWKTAVLVSLFNKAAGLSMLKSLFNKV